MKALSHAPSIVLTAALLTALLGACKRNDTTVAAPATPGETATAPATTPPPVNSGTGTSGTSGTSGTTGTSGSSDDSKPADTTAAPPKDDSK
jgi:hypothetical protein